MKKRAVLTQAVFLSAMFSIPALAETVVACTSDGTLYVHVVGSDTVTVKNNGCQGGPWVIRASVAVRGSLQITPGSGDVNKAVQSLKSLAAESPSTTVPANSAEFQRATAAAELQKGMTRDKIKDMKVVEQSELPASAYSLVAGGTEPRHPCAPGTTWDGTKCAGTPVVHAGAANVVNTSRSNVKDNFVFEPGPAGKTHCKAPDGRPCTQAQIEPLTLGSKSVKKIALGADGAVTCDGKACTTAQIAELNSAALKGPGEPQR
jgi:hypothetical protein